MTSPKATPATPATAPTPTALSASAIAETGARLTGLIVALIPLSMRAIDTLSTTLPRIISGAKTTADTLASSQDAQSLASSTSDLISASADLSLSLIKVALRGLDTTVRTVNAVVQESRELPRT